MLGLGVDATTAMFSLVKSPLQPLELQRLGIALLQALWTDATVGFVDRTENFVR